MGRFGSPYAALSFTAVDPALAEFDTAATPLEQFLDLVDAVHARRGGVLIDIAINHTGWAAGLHESHPQWLVRDEAGQIEMPGAWGVTWADLTRLDYSRKDLWQYMAGVFLTWCRRGVDGFRCDAGYMIPAMAWRYIIARVREQYPETIFFLEGLGGKISVTRNLLNRAGFDWAYSELFQNTDRSAIEHYLPQAMEISAGDGVTVHFAETHDNNRLAARSAAWARMRTALCALLSHQGAFAFANGVEWLATEKIDVHGAPSLNWGAGENQVDQISRLNALLRTHPAFFPDTELTMIQSGEGNHLVVRRRHGPDGRRLLIVVNLDDRRPVTAMWPTEKWPETDLKDLLTGQTVTVGQKNGQAAVDLSPGQVILPLKRFGADRQLVRHLERFCAVNRRPSCIDGSWTNAFRPRPSIRAGRDFNAPVPRPGRHGYSTLPPGPSPGNCTTTPSLSAGDLNSTMHRNAHGYRLAMALKILHREVMVPPRTFFARVGARYPLSAPTLKKIGRVLSRRKKPGSRQRRGRFFALFCASGDRHSRHTSLTLNLSVLSVAATVARCVGNGPRC